MSRVRFIVFSDYLCPWCYNGSVRLQRLADAKPGRVELEWRSYLLRPHPGARRDLEKFRVYTRSWLRPAAEADGGTFQVWTGDRGPPSHSVPPHLVAKAAARLGPDAFRRAHEGLLRAYFAENRDISDDDTLRALWAEWELPAEAYETRREPALLEQVMDEYNQAFELGVTGVPAVLLEGNPALIVGAQPFALYERWAERALAAAEIA
ncbi:MAG: DsbA family protein [Proteobacteria bacterium]|nr:DsbA family protein [Pseudomonadota bacterium]